MATKKALIRGILRASRPGGTPLPARPIKGGVPKPMPTRPIKGGVPVKIPWGQRPKGHRPPIFGGPKDGRPDPTKPRGGRRGPIFGGPKDGRPVVRRPKR